MDEDLNLLRDEVDSLDDEIQKLITARAEVALRIGNAKRATGATVHHPEREAQVLARVRANNEGPLDDAIVADIFKRIIVACRELQDR